MANAAHPGSSTRRQIYELLRSLPDHDPIPRILMLAAYFEGLPADQVPAAERRMLAFTQAYKASLDGGLKGTLDDFFAAVDDAERNLVN